MAKGTRSVSSHFPQDEATARDCSIATPRHARTSSAERRCARRNAIPDTDDRLLRWETTCTFPGRDGPFQRCADDDASDGQWRRNGDASNIKKRCTALFCCVTNLLYWTSPLFQFLCDTFVPPRLHCPGGTILISRWLSTATPPVSLPQKSVCIPAGCHRPGGAI